MATKSLRDEKEEWGIVKKKNPWLNIITMLEDLHNDFDE